MRFSRFPDSAGFEAYDAPDAAQILYIHACVSVAPGDFTLRTSAAHFGARGHQRGRSIHANLPVTQLDGIEVHAAGAEVGQRLFLGLQDSRILGSLNL